jgi:hypothetical protein
MSNKFHGSQQQAQYGGSGRVALLRLVFSPLPTVIAMLSLFVGMYALARSNAPSHGDDGQAVLRPSTAENNIGPRLAPSALQSPNATVDASTTVLPSDSPLCERVLQYFPDALACARMAHVSTNGDCSIPSSMQPSFSRSRPSLSPQELEAEDIAGWCLSLDKSW